MNAKMPLLLSVALGLGCGGSDPSGPPGSRPPPAPVATNAVEIRDNFGAGIWADVNGMVRLGSLPPTPVPADPCAPPPWTGITVTGNDDKGVLLLHMSIAESFAGNSLSGNTTANVDCDNTSLLFGDLTGIAVNKCATTERGRPQ